MGRIVCAPPFEPTTARCAVSSAGSIIVNRIALPSGDHSGAPRREETGSVVTMVSRTTGAPPAAATLRIAKPVAGSGSTYAIDAPSGDQRRRLMPEPPFSGAITVGWQVPSVDTVMRWLPLASPAAY